MSTLKPIRVQFVGIQFSRFGNFALYNLLEPLADLHPAGSTVSLNTLHLHGYTPAELPRVEMPT